MHRRITHACLAVPRPPNFGLSRHAAHVPQSVARQGAHWRQRTRRVTLPIGTGCGGWSWSWRGGGGRSVPPEAKATRAAPPLCRVVSDALKDIRSSAWRDLSAPTIQSRLLPSSAYHPFDEISKGSIITPLCTRLLRLGPLLKRDLVLTFSSCGTSHDTDFGSGCWLQVHFSGRDEASSASTRRQFSASVARPSEAS